MQIENFSHLGLSPEICDRLEKAGIVAPTPIQVQSIEALMKRENVLGIAKTGSGKTLAFLLGMIPFLERDTTTLQMMILVPTRELAQQVAATAQMFMTADRVATCVGGYPIERDKVSLAKNPHILVATPGRLDDLMGKELIDLRLISMLVIDEVDRMFDMGFAPIVEKITKVLSTMVQKALFSATLTEKVKALVDSFCSDCRSINLFEEQVSSLENYFIECENKFDTLSTLLMQETYEKVIIFCNTKEETQTLYKRLDTQGIETRFFDGSLEQYERDEVLIEFNNGSTRVLIASDLASRGLDIETVDLVIQYDIAFKKEVFTHRIGRTARQDRRGKAITLVGARDHKYLNHLIEEGVAIEALTITAKGKGHFETARYQTVVLLKGKKDKLRKGDIVGSLCKEGGMRVESIGNIDLTAKRTYVAIERSSIKQALDFFKSKSIKGKKVKAFVL